MMDRVLGRGYKRGTLIGIVREGREDRGRTIIIQGKQNEPTKAGGNRTV